MYQGFRLNLGKNSKMNYFVSLLTTFNSSIILGPLGHYLELARTLN